MTHLPGHTREDMQKGESHGRLLLSPSAAIDGWLRRTWPPADLPPAALPQDHQADAMTGDAAMLELE